MQVYPQSNSVLLLQEGEELYSDLIRKGEDLQLSAEQYGWENMIFSRQEGRGNSSFIYQYNVIFSGVEIIQNGRDNNIDSLQ